MAEYIEREALMKYFNSNCCGECCSCSHDTRGDCMIIKEFPAVDVQHVVRGKNLNEEWPSLFECSICHWSCWDTYCGDTDTYNYCPNCGARMDGGT